VKNNYNQILNEINEQLQFVSLEIEDVVKRSETSIDIILKALAQLKILVLKAKFTQGEEIIFFKEIKPLLLSKLVYHNKVYKIEMKKPQGGDKVLRKYYNLELDKLKRYFDNELDFYRYYRSNSTYLDHKYFVRDKHDIKLSLDTFYFEADHRFTTTHDYKVAKIIANDLVQVYLENEINYIDRKEPKPKNSEFPKTKLNWAASKTDLTELIYSLQTSNIFGSNTDIKEIASYFENVFNIDLGDYYRIYMELRIRKTGRTKFVDSLKEKLIKRMDEEDSK